MAIDMSPEAIERRLRQVSEARKLGLSLRRAGEQIGDALSPVEPEKPLPRNDGDLQRRDRVIP